MRLFQSTWVYASLSNVVFSFFFSSFLVLFLFLPLCRKNGHYVLMRTFNLKRTVVFVIVTLLLMVVCCYMIQIYPLCFVHQNLILVDIFVTTKFS